MPKSWFTKNEVGQSQIMHFQSKMTNSDKWTVLANFLSRFLLVSNCLNSVKKYSKSYWLLNWILCEFGYRVMKMWLYNWMCDKRWPECTPETTSWSPKPREIINPYKGPNRLVNLNLIWSFTSKAHGEDVAYGDNKLSHRKSSLAKQKLEHMNWMDNN